MQHPGGFEIDHPGLGGHVQGAAGRVLQGQTHDPQIRRDDPVGAAALQEFKISGQRLHLPVAGQDVDGDVDLPAGFVRQRHGMPQAFLVKIGGGGSLP